MVKLALLIPLVYFLAFLVNISFGRRLKEKSAWVALTASGLALLYAALVAKGFLAGEGSFSLGRWLPLGNTALNFGVNIDALAVMMLVVVTIVGTLIQIYSIGYMKDDPRYSRYFAYLSLFMASMAGLVLADNFVMLYIFWEGVGLCSYLLISFWFEREAAARAGLKAFLVTRVGDTGLLLGIILLFLASGTLSFAGLDQITGNETLLAVAALLIFLGAVGKSAQFPLHVWLPDAMEGPTAVSALIHAATMVAAGVYLVMRTYGLFVAHPLCLQVVAVVGAISALLAASIALVNNDIKRILAYSTISQLGLMMVGLGVGGYSAGGFHLMTHAFFKALLFLCAGSVIHAVHTQDIHKMGGLLSRMKITGLAFIVGSMAIAGVPPFAGFWSKDEILVETLKTGHPFLFGAVLLVSLMTAFYTARMIFLVLFGKPRFTGHAHESPASMTVPLIILAVFAAFTGLAGSPLTHYAFQHFLSFGTHAAPGEVHYGILLLSTLVSFAGIGLAYSLYLRGAKIVPVSIRVRFGWLYRLVQNKYYIDEIYDAVLVNPFRRVCAGLFRFDQRVVDGIVNGVASGVKISSDLLRFVQTGLVQNYLLIQVLGVIVFIVIVLRKICFRF